jgi:hypothetical protein
VMRGSKPSDSVASLRQRPGQYLVLGAADGRHQERRRAILSKSTRNDIVK